MPKKESLPLGVGRVPEWWMELTPHYVLDLDDDEQQRKMMEEQEVMYYAQMAANDDGSLMREWKSHWGGRTTTTGADDGGASALFGGRNFQPGSSGWDPKEWGIDANDPDYTSYLKGAKLPQSYIDAMMEFAHTVGLQYDASALNPTGGARNAGGRPGFTPAWAKKKLRATGQGAAIRHGIYNDSPNKHINSGKHRVNAHMVQQQVPATPDLEPTTTPEPVVVTAPPEAAPPEAAPPMVEKPKWKPPPPTPPPVHVVEKAPPMRINTPAPAPPEPQDTSVEKPKYSFNDYYYNAGAPVTPVKAPTPVQEAPKPSPVSAPVPPPPVAAPVPAPAAPEAQPEEDEEEYEEIVEYVEEYEDGEEGEEYEEIVEEYVEEEEEPAAVVPQSADLNDLQALLAQKQAELARLQGV